MTREENLRWLNQEIQTWENECQSKHPIKEALYAARRALEQESRWIPITERLPNKSGRYLVSYNSGYVAMALYYESVSKWGATTTERIVAWMPLPQPYKAESEET